MQKHRKILAWATFALYCVVMIYLLFARTRGGIRGLSLVPLATIKEFWTVIVQSVGNTGTEWLFLSSFVNLAGNVLMFVPLGFFLPLLWRRLKRWWADFAICAGVIIAVELLQFVTARGSADIDDFILNMLGAGIGYAVFALVKKLKRS